MQLPKIHHLIRYVIIIGIIAFAAYLKKWRSENFLILLGPAMYLSSAIKERIVTSIPQIPSTDKVNYYGFFLPITLIYFSMIGLLIKQLWNERGAIRFLSLLCMLGFLGFVHYTAWKNILGYLVAD